MGKCLINGTNNNSKDGRAIQILNFLVDKGLTPKQACAVCGNCFVESNKRYDPKAYNPNDNGGPSYGLFQWHDKNGSGRFTDLKNYCKSNGLDYTTIGGQLSFLWHENAGNFKQYFSSNTNLSIDAYTQWWEKKWEVCGDCHHSERLAEANRLAGLYNQTNKGECTVELTGGSGVGSGIEGGEFSCSETDNLDSSINLGIDPSVYATGPEGEQVITADSNTVDTKIALVGDYVAYNVWKNSSLYGNTRAYCKKEGVFGDTAIINTVKSMLSDKNIKPKCIIIYLGNGLWVGDAKLKTEVMDAVNSWLNKLVDVTKYTEVAFVSSVHSSKDAVNGTNGGEGSYQYVYNQTVKEWVNDPIHYHAHYIEMTYVQNRILEDYVYRKRVGKAYSFTNEGLKFIGDWIWYLLPGKCKF